GELTPTDPVFRIMAASGSVAPAGTDTLGTSADYRTYFDLYRVTIDKPENYEVTVVPKAGNAWLVQPIIIPIIRVLGPAGEVLAAESAAHVSGGRPSRRAECHLMASGDYFVLVGADNSMSGGLAGYDQVRGPGLFRERVPLASCGEGKYSIRITPIEKP